MLIVVIGLALALLVLAQLYLARISRRILNAPALLATVVLAAVSIWAVVGLIGEQSALASARRGSDAVEVLSATRVLLSRAQSDQSLTLVNRGSDETDPADFAAVMRELAPNGGLLGGVSALARRTGTSSPANRLTAVFASYQAETAQITMLESNGRILDAIRRASAASASSIADRLNAGLAGQITTAQGRFMSAAAAAASSLSGLSVAIPVLTALAAALALMALRQRLSEYR